MEQWDQTESQDENLFRLMFPCPSFHQQIRSFPWEAIAALYNQIVNAPNNLYHIYITIYVYVNVYTDIHIYITYYNVLYIYIHPEWIEKWRQKLPVHLALALWHLNTGTWFLRGSNTRISELSVSAGCAAGSAAGRRFRGFVAFGRFQIPWIKIAKTQKFERNGMCFKNL